MIRIDVEMYGFPHAAGPELDRLIKGPVGETLSRWEAALSAGFATSESRVHVITGALKASMNMSSQLGADTWTGQFGGARYPGIYELARGNMPTKYHPAGGHYFLGPGGQDFEREVRQALWDWVTDGDGGPAPSEGLGWKSGGNA